MATQFDVQLMRATCHGRYLPIAREFVPEGRGGEIEQARDVEVAVAIGRDGRARIRHLIVDGSRWR